MKTIGIHKNCQEFVAGNLRLAVTTEVGPRIIGLYIGKSRFNHFVVLPPTPFAASDNGFCLYGGHRLWHSPEALPRSYEPDNEPVKIREYDSGVEFSSGPAPTTGIEKKILVEPLTNGLFCITHTIANCGLWPVELAPWAMSMMAPGGTVVIPQNRDPENDPYAPERTLALWPYSRLNDPRLSFGDQHIFLRQDPKVKENFKLGLNNTAGWVAYVNHGQALVKYFDYDPEADYPDGGCTVETFTCPQFTEVETMGTLETLEPGECAQHVEYWQGIDNLPDLKTDDDVNEHLFPHLLVSEDLDDDGGCDCGCEDDECCCHDHGH